MANDTPTGDQGRKEGGRICSQPIHTSLLCSCSIFEESLNEWMDALKAVKYQSTHCLANANGNFD